MVRDDYRKQFESLGLERVRTLIETGRIAGHRHPHAKAWVNEHDRVQQRAESERSEASSREQILIARSAKNAAWIAAIAAIIAAISAAISIVLYLLKG